MDKLKVGIIDLVGKGPTDTLWARVMHANLASIMPQVVATWCEQAGHEVTFTCYTGLEDVRKEMPGDVDIVFICSFTQAAFLAYAISHRFRSQGVVTVLGGPHARCYPDDAVRYFDYVLGFTDKSLVMDVLAECAPHAPEGVFLKSARQPADLPGVRERWKFIEPTLRKAPFLKMVPMIGSMGCPYTCSFCIDSVVPYQPLELEGMKEDLRFIRTRFRRPYVSWHDPNFGIRFNETMDAIEEAVPPGSIKFIAESSLSVLSEPNLRRLKKNGFLAMLPGIESWYEMGNKSKAGRIAGEQRLKKVTEHVNLVMRHVPYLQTNFVLGLDSDSGDEPFELTKRFVDAAPGAFPGYSLLSAFGEAAPSNLEYQRDDRVLPFPFPFLNNNLAMNVKPRNYDWIEFYDRIIDLTSYTFSRKAILRRWTHNSGMTPKWMNLVRAISSEGHGRIRFFKKVRARLHGDEQFRGYFERRHDDLPSFYLDIIKRDLGHLWQWFPREALRHEQNAYLNKQKPVMSPEPAAAPA